MNGIICIDKPMDFTSFDVVAKIRSIIRIKRIGHAGTLDPMATGVLPIFIGNATKVCDILPDNDKGYRAGFKLGLSTNTQDITGEKLDSRDASAISEDIIADAISSFVGDIMQIPPMFSAVKIDGKRLYKLARQGIEVDRPPREATISEIKLLSYNQEDSCGELEIHCSQGTYVRTIIHDLGEMLGVGGVMTSLVRTKSGIFTLLDCITIEQVQKYHEEGILDRRLMATHEALIGYEDINLNEKQSKMFYNGVKLDSTRISGCDSSIGIYRIFDSDGNFMAVGEIDDSKTLRMKKSFFSGR
ncbi:MAG: tRNA pseudouridine(55) synthase TruB [Clostridiales bacterium]|nr:tRNA pseudouridine(55) synthase TruB [Clostridiales bacterium]